MKRGRKPQLSKGAVEIKQPIGHLSAPIEDEDLERVQAILKRHAVDVRKTGSPDNWWLLLLPDGTLKTRKVKQGRVTISTIRVPDGFSFVFEEGIFKRNGTYATSPRVFIEEEPADVQS